jgi:hypothetical protein
MMVSLVMPIIHAGAQDASAQNPITVDQVMLAVEDQLKAISTKELKWKGTLTRPPSPAMADRFAERARKLESSAPSNELEAKDLALQIRNERGMEDSYRHASVSYAIWTLRFHDYGRYLGTRTGLSGGKESSKRDYVGEAPGPHRIIDHTTRTIDLTRKSNVLFNTVNACPPLVIVHYLRMDGYPKEKVNAQIMSADDAHCEVRFQLRNRKAMKAKFTLPHFSCVRIALQDSGGREFEIMESSASWKNVPGLPFQPAVWTQTFGTGGSGHQRTWEFIEAKDVGPEGYKEFKEPEGYRTFSEEEGIP